MYIFRKTIYKYEYVLLAVTFYCFFNVAYVEKNLKQVS